MKLKIFAIYDQAAGAYLAPFFLPEEGQAKRAFNDCIQDPTHQFGLNAADYTLFNIGAFDDNNAKIIPQSPISLGNGIEYITPKSNLEAVS